MSVEANLKNLRRFPFWRNYGEITFSRDKYNSIDPAQTVYIHWEYKKQMYITSPI